jgi:dTDP-4-dehydrorhamnose reductase
VIDFAQKNGVSMWITPEDVLPVPSSAFATPAKRPLNSRLDTTKLQNTFGLHLPHWQAGVARMLTETLDK